MLRPLLDSSDNDLGEATTISQDRPSPLRNEPIQYPKHIRLDRITTTQGWGLKIGDSVELQSETRDTEQDRDGDFFRIKFIFEDAATSKVYLRGWRFRRNSLIQSRTVPTLLNELVMLIDEDLDDHRPLLEQGMETIPVNHAYKKRKLNLTNESFPAHSFRSHTAYSTAGSDAAANKKAIRDSSELACRWMAVTRFATGSHRLQFYDKVAREAASGKVRVHTEGLIRRLHTVEADETCAARDSMLIYQWLGYFPWRPETNEGQVSNRRKMADVCCGGGFAALGAKRAGLDVAWGLDFDKDAVATFRLNHPDSTIYCVEVGEFIHFVAFEEHHVQVLHVSFPCQFFSPAHTHVGVNDDANSAASFALRELLLRIKPRIVTFEQTSGLLTHHTDWFQAIVRMFTETGYSVRWKIYNLAELGLAHNRKRLIIVASCPGSALPPFPDPTHGPNGHYPFVTIAEALAPLDRVTERIPRHNPSSMPRLDLPRYSAHTQLRHTVTTSGTPVYHPSGTRKFTVREAVLLQSAPLDFEFPDDQSQTTAMRQTGNAFPTVPACAIFTNILMALDLEDAEMGQQQ